MDFEAYLGANYQLPLQVAGEIMHPISPDILIHDGMLSRNVVASHMDSSFGHLSHPTAASLSTQLIFNDMNPGVLINNPYFEPSMETNALMTNFHSAAPIQDGSYRSNSNVNLQSSSSATSNLSITRSLCFDHLLVPQQLSQAVQCQPEQHKRQHNQLNVLSPLPQSILQANQVTVPLLKFDESAQVQKKPRLESNKKDDLFLRHMIQQLLLSESSKQFTSHDLPRQYHVLNALQRETIPSLPKSIEAHCQQLVAQQPLTNFQKQLPERQVSQIPVLDEGICAARLKQYLHHQRNRPKQNNIAYWRKLVAEYFAFDAKKRWCFSNDDHVGHSAFSQAILDSWSCDICGTKSGRGFEVTFEVLPRLCKVNFEGGVTDKLLYLDFPCESKLPLGRMMLQYAKAVQETVYKHSRVVHEGQLRIIFTKELKIMSWEFCTRHHEEFVPRRLIAPQVNQLVQAAQKYQDNNVEQNKSDGGLRHTSQATHNRFLKAGDQLAKTLDSQIVSDYGFSKQLVRFFQTAELVTCMKDLMAYSLENNLGPIESLNRYAQGMKFKQTQMYERALHQDPQAFSSTGNKPILKNSFSTQFPFDKSFVLNSGAGAADETWSSTAGTNYCQRLLMGNTMGNTNLNGITSVGHSSEQPNSSVQASRNPLDSSTWNSFQNLGNSIPPSTNMTVKPGPSWHEAAPSSICKSITQPMSSTGNLSTISFAQGDHDTRKYVLNKLLMEKIFSSETQQPKAPQPTLTSCAKGKNEAVSKGAGGSQRKTTSKTGPSKGTKSSTRAQPSSLHKTGNSTLKFKGPSIKKEMDMEEEHDIPILPGVKVKKEQFYG